MAVKKASKKAAKPASKKAPAQKSRKPTPAAGDDDGEDAPKKSTGKSLVSYDEMIAKLGAKGQRDAEREADTGSGGMPGISTEGKQFVIPGENEDEDFGDSFTCVVGAFAFANAWYDTPYVKGSAQVPACYAVALDEDDLAPPDDAPVRQADSCAECPLNEYESAANGRGKACGNRRKLVVFALSDLEEGILRPIRMSLPPTSLKFWGRYVKAIARQHKLSPAGVVTRFDFDPENPQPAPMPVFEGLIDPEHLALIYDSLDEAEETVLELPDPSGYTAPDDKPARKNKMQRGGAAKAEPKGAKPTRPNLKPGAGFKKPAAGKKSANAKAGRR